MNEVVLGLLIGILGLAAHNAYILGRMNGAVKDLKGKVQRIQARCPLCREDR